MEIRLQRIEGMLYSCHPRSPFGATKVDPGHRIDLQSRVELSPCTHCTGLWVFDPEL